MKTAVMLFAIATLFLATAAAGRELMASSMPVKADYCTCEPYNETRTPAEICAAKDPYDTTVFCNAGGHFPVPGQNRCRRFFQCTAGGEAEFKRCPKGTRWDVAFNTCVHKKLEIDGKEVCTNKCTGFLYKPYQGCYNVKSLNSGAGAWGLFNSGTNAFGCDNDGEAAAGVGSSGMFAAGCGNSGTAAWGRSVSGEGSCGAGVSDGQSLSG